MHEPTKQDRPQGDLPQDTDEVIPPPNREVEENDTDTDDDELEIISDTEGKKEGV